MKSHQPADCPPLHSFEPKKDHYGFYCSLATGQICCIRSEQNLCTSRHAAEPEVSDTSLTIAADTFCRQKAFHDFELFRQFKQRIADKQTVNMAW